MRDIQNFVGSDRLGYGDPLVGYAAAMRGSDPQAETITQPRT